MKRIGNGLMTSLIGIGIAAGAARWLITPINHPDASDARVTAVVIQLVLGVAMVAWGYRQDREDRRVRGPQYEVFASGVVTLLIGTMLAATALHWLITPAAHPDATSLRAGLVWAQALVGIAFMMASRSRLREEVAA